MNHKCAESFGSQVAKYALQGRKFKSLYESIHFHARVSPYIPDIWEDEAMRFVIFDTKICFSHQNFMAGAARLFSY